MTSRGRFAEVAIDINNKCKVLSMPFGEVDCSMLIVLPDEDNGLPELESNLSAELIRDWMGQLRSREVNIFLPKFTMTGQLNLKDVLQNMHGLG